MKLSFLNHIFAAILFAAAALPAIAVEAPLFELDRPAAKIAPQHALDSRINFRLDRDKLLTLAVGETVDLPLPDQRIIRARVARLQALIGGTTNRHTVLSIEGGRGSIEFLYSGSAVNRVRISDIQSTIRVYEATLDINGIGELQEQDANDYYCIEMPVEAQVSLQSPPDQSVLTAFTPGLAQLQALQSKPTANKVLYLNYWGGALSGTRWNDQYNNGNEILYTKYSSDDDPDNFSDEDLDLIWMGWREVVEDYAPFDVNVTTDQSVYDAAAAEDRSMIIATTSYAWFGSEAGGVANFDSFGSDYSGVGWAWNKSLGAFGQTMSHEAGHQMGLHHDGTDLGVTYYRGHGTNDEWGPIMGAPYGQTYVQWSKGEYDNANQGEDDLVIIKDKLGEDADVVGDTLGTAFEMASSAYLEGVIEPRGLLTAMDMDVYQFEISPGIQSVQIQVAPVLGDDLLRFGSNLSLYAQLTQSDGVTVLVESTQLSPFLPQNNVLSYDGLLDPGTYYLFVSAQSPNVNLSTGFGEYADAGIYSVSLMSETIEPDLLSDLNVEDSDVYIGQAIYMNSRIENIGAAASVLSTAKLYLFTDDIPPLDYIEIVERDIPALSPLESVFFTEQVVMPDTPGVRYFASCVDEVPDESVVSNNCSTPVMITVNDLALDLDIGGALEQASLGWVRGGDGSFFRQTTESMNDGDAAQSGEIDHDEISYVQVDVSGQVWLQFHWKVSSEDDFDYFRFMDNGQEIASISGETGWEPVTHKLDAGPHRLQWVYDKDTFAIDGQDTGWLDNVVFLDRKLDITPFDADDYELDSETVTYSFTVQSDGASTAPASVAYTVAGFGANPADAADFGGALPAGTINFGAHEMIKVVEVDVSGDVLLEPDETFTLTLGNPVGAILGETISVQSLIRNDDDDDGDGIQDTLDNCPLISNADQTDTDDDTKGNACDDDDDDDLALDTDDNCPLDVNPDQLDTDGDDTGDACDPDIDNDGVLNGADISSMNPLLCEDIDSDNCDDCAIGVDGFGIQADNTPANDGIDTDANGQCDLGDADNDGDGTDDIFDNCPLISNAGQTDTDGDTKGNACDDDDDNDLVLDIDDNCPLDANPDQKDVCSMCFPVKLPSASVAIICL